MDRTLFLLCLLPILFLACEDQDEPSPVMTGLFQKGDGVFVINEGGFNFGNASIDYYDFESEDKQSEIFKSINEEALGDVLQSFTIVDDLGYLVLNNSGKIEVVRMDSFHHVQTISGFNSPRQLLAIHSEEAYVSDLYASAITRINLKTGDQVGTIPFPGWSESMILLNGLVYVSNPWDRREDATSNVYVIDPQIHQIIDSISVGYDPSAMVVDANQKLWVFCRGNEAATAFGGLYQIDPFNQTVLKSMAFTDFNHSFAPRLVMNNLGTELFYLKEDVFQVAIDAVVLPSTPLIAASGRLFYGLAIDPHNNSFWIADAIDFQQQGRILNYTLDGNVVTEFTGGVIPAGFLFY